MQLFHFLERQALRRGLVSLFAPEIELLGPEYFDLEAEPAKSYRLSHRAQGLEESFRGYCWVCGDRVFANTEYGKMHYRCDVCFFGNRSVPTEYQYCIGCGQAFAKYVDIGRSARKYCVGCQAERAILSV